MMKVLRWTLRLFPRAFRERYGDELCQALLLKMRDVRARHGLTAAVRVWVFQLFDLLRSARSERAYEHRARHTDVPGEPSSPRRAKGDPLPVTIWKDLMLALRRFRRNRSFAFVVVLTLALGIGANSAIFSVVNGVLLTPLPYEEPDRLAGVWHTAPGVGFDILNQAPALHFTYLDAGSVFEELGMWQNNSVSVTGIEEPEQVAVVYVTAGTLPALRAQPHIGRRFTAEDDSPGTPETVILSYGYWQSHFGGDPGAVGRTLRIDGRSMEIIGVMPQDFRFLRYNPSLFLPFRFDRTALYVGDFSYQALARLAPGVTIEQANAEIDRMIPQAVEQYPGGFSLELLEQARFAAALRPLMQDVVGNVGDVLWVLLGTVGIVLLIACANVANLFLVRAEGREREVAVRTAIGADRGQVAAQFLTESVTLGVLGGIAGLGLATSGLRFLKSMESVSLPRLNEITLDPTVLLFTLGISILAGLFFGIFPVLKYRRLSLVTALKEGGWGSSSGRERHRARNTLVVAQMALALVLLIGSGLMIRTFQALRNVDAGFRNPEEVLTLRLSIPPAEIAGGVEAARTHELIARRIAEIPGVTSVGLSSSITMDGWNSNDPIYVEGFPTPDGQLPPVRRFKFIGEGYFATMQNLIVAGRDITWADIHDLNPVVVITENFAREYWGEPADALGKRISSGLGPGAAGWREIVGVVGDIRDDGTSQDPVPTIFWPMITPNLWSVQSGGETISCSRNMAYAIRSPRVTSGELLREVRQATWAVNSNLPLALVRTVEEIQDSSMARTSFTLVMLGIAAAVAMILGVIGVYGVISYVVSQRTREIGVRIALGANTVSVSTMVLRQALVMAGVGVGTGALAAIALTRLMGTLLYGVSPTDPVTFLTVSLVLTGSALLASYLPARRAAATDPVDALRSE